MRGRPRKIKPKKQQKQPALQLVQPANLREETDYTQYYPELDPEQDLSVRIEEHPHKVAHKDKELYAYTEARRQNDAAILSRLKKPHFRKTRQESGDEFGLVPRKYLKLGYHDVKSHREGRRDTDIYTRSDVEEKGRYALFKGSLQLDGPFQVLYDMDEQDRLFVDYLNQDGKIYVSPELFEITMTFLERQDFYVKQVMPLTAKDETAVAQRQVETARMYGSDDGKGISLEEDQCCAVCNTNFASSANAIVFCDGCNIAVHQECYGIPFIPEGPWLCRRCLISRRDQNHRCLFCPSTTGAFKQTDNGYWAHVICALWINELYFANPIYMEPIEGLQNVPQTRWRLSCYICKQSVGACVQCCKNNCFTAYHVTCARRAGLYMEMTKGIKKAIEDKSTSVSYCHRHTPADWALHHDTHMGIERTRLYYRSTKANGSSTDSTISVSEAVGKELAATKSEQFRWKTAKGGPVVPQIFVERLTKFLDSRLRAKHSPSVITQLCKYWTMKREVSQAPLIRRPDPSNYGSLTNEEVEERRTVLERIKEDTEKLVGLADGIVRRSETEQALNEEIVSQAELFYYPSLYAVHFLGQQFLKCDERNVLSGIDTAPGVINGPELATKIRWRKHNTVQELIDDIEELSRFVLAHEGKSSGGYRLIKSIWGKSKRRKYLDALAWEKMAAEAATQDAYEPYSREGLTIKEKEQ